MWEYISDYGKPNKTMKPRSSIPHRRKRPRRKRPELTRRPKQCCESWAQISMRVRLKWWEQSNWKLLCALCGKPIEYFSQLVPDHIVPGKMGGCKDHSEENLQPAHWWCNNAKGSKREPMIQLHAITCPCDRCEKARKHA